MFLDLCSGYISPSTDVCNLQLVTCFSLEHMLYICGKFYNRYKLFVEPFSKPMSMIPDLTCTCHVEIAMLLLVLVRRMASLRLWVYHEIILITDYYLSYLNHPKFDSNLILPTYVEPVNWLENQIMKLVLLLQVQSR